MRAVALGGDGRLEVVDRPDPDPGLGEVVVAVERCGICGSDLHLRRSGLLAPGAVLGHEFAGTVAALGPGVGAQLRKGQRVAVLPSQRCGACAACRAGRSNLCPAQHATVLGLGVNDGGFAEYVRVPASSCHLLPAGMTTGQGVLVEPYAVALHAVARSRAGGARPGSAVTAAVVGAGTVGLLCVAALHRAGVERVVVAEPNPRRGAVAATMGAVVVDDAQRVGRVLGAAPDVVFDTAGVVTTTPLSLEIVAVGGQVVLLGVVGPGEPLAMPGLLWVLKEVEVVASIAYTEKEFAAAVVAVGAGAAEAVDAAADVRPMEDAERAFQDLASPGAPVKVILSLSPAAGLRPEPPPPGRPG